MSCATLCGCRVLDLSQTQRIESRCLQDEPGPSGVDAHQRAAELEADVAAQLRVRLTQAAAKGDVELGRRAVAALRSLRGDETGEGVWERDARNAQLTEAGFDSQPLPRAQARPVRLWHAGRWRRPWRL